jgi:hypothetical protein
MEKEPRANINLIERGNSEIKLSYQYKDKYDRLFGSFESEKLYPLSDPSSNEATYFDGSVETPYGNFMLECEITEAKEALALIADFIEVKEKLANLEKQLDEARIRLDIAVESFRQGGEPNYEASRLVNDLQRQQFQLEAKSKVQEEGLKKYKI